MTKVSRIPMSLKEKLDAIDEFWTALGNLNKNQIEHFFKDFFSPTETFMFAKRLEILKGLRKNIKYEHLHMALKVGEPTIAKMSVLLQRGDTNFLSILDGLIHDEDRRWKAYLDSRKPHPRGKMVFYVDRKE